MKKLALALILAALALPATAQISVLSGCGNFTSGRVSGNQSCQLSVAQGKQALVFAYADNAGPVPSFAFTDTDGDSATAIQSPENLPANTNLQLAIWWVASFKATNATETVNVACGGEPDCTVVVEQIGGSVGADGWAAAVGGSSLFCGNYGVGTTYSTTNAADLIIEATGWGTSPYTSCEGWAALQTGTGWTTFSNAPGLVETNAAAQLKSSDTASLLLPLILVALKPGPAAGVVVLNGAVLKGGVVK